MGEKAETLIINGMSLSDLLTLFACDIENDDDFYFRLAQNIALMDFDYLPKHLHEYSGSRLRGAVFGIGLSPEKSEKQQDILLSLLSHSDPLIVTEALDSLRRAGYGAFWPRIEPLLQHKSPYVIGAALRYARFALSPEKALAILTNVLQNPDSIVRQNALDELGDLGDKRALAVIRPYCDDSDPDVKQAANTAYEAITDVAKEREQSA